MVYPKTSKDMLRVRHPLGTLGGLRHIHMDDNAVLNKHTGTGLNSIQRNMISDEFG